MTLRLHGPTRRAPAARLLVFVCLLAACDKTRGSSDRAPPGSARAAASASAAPGPAASAAPSAARFTGDGCHAGVSLQGSAAERARAVAEACAPGATPLGPIGTFSGPGELRLELGAGAACVRVIAVAEHADADLSLEVFDEQGASRGADALPGSVALVGTQGPLCFASDKALVAKVGFVRGAGSVVVSAHRL